MSERTQEEINQWHRYYGVVCNNRGWDLATTSSRSEAQDVEMLDAAHAAAYHWGKIGTELQKMRAITLLAEVHAQLGIGKTAVEYAQTAFEFYTNRDTDDWETALIHSVMAHAAHAAGDSNLHATHYDLAKKGLEAIVNEKDREIIEQTFNLLPVPTGAEQ